MHQAGRILVFLIVLAVCFLAPNASSLAATGDCAQPPADAVVALPAPLSDWGTLLCTPYGYVITARQGWIWSQPTAYAPVFVPAQMVQNDPKTLGSSAYFAKIEFAPAQDAAFEAARQIAFTGMDGDPKGFTGYRLDTAGYDGKTLQLYFFEDGSTRWGIWCPHGKCDRSSLFMVLDMSQRPG